ncbi:hypothetical protein RhiirA4_455959 [Rhizophagus irregularis]|uniref:Uncharacterized protein n=1 Tax=Rhizophagus irregularis TaxID=588596 RepID=A0A2I1G6F3_9GLOM|nr:hypothetical protein RhiirA4_455959 [Rhizophagus irregularis]
MGEEEFKNNHLSEFARYNCNDVCDEAILSNKDEHVLLYSEKKFQLWKDCETFINGWAK